MSTVNVAIAVHDSTVEIEAEFLFQGKTIHVPNVQLGTQVCLSDIVPLARQIADGISEATIQTLQLEGDGVSCRKGCNACCNYLVPLSVPEVLRMGEELSALPEDSKDIVSRRFEDAIRCIVKSVLPSIPPQTTTLPNGATVSPLGVIGQWYWRLNIGCPIFINGACELYDQRPVACRQHLASSSSDLCKGFQPGRGRVVPMPTNICYALALLASELEGTPVESVLLPLTMCWMESNAQRGLRSWPAKMVVERFLEIVESIST